MRTVCFWFYETQNIFLKINKALHFRSLESSLFDSITADGEKEFLKKLCLMLKYCASSTFFVL